MFALIIEQEGKIKEAFSYERPLNKGSHQALVEYARANYGPGSSVRRMTSQEERNFFTYGPVFLLQSRTRKGGST